jgi:hypothetical protein
MARWAAPAPLDLARNESERGLCRGERGRSARVVGAHPLPASRHKMRSGRAHEEHDDFANARAERALEGRRGRT